jgi:hypothetical protein
MKLKLQLFTLSLFGIFACNLTKNDDFRTGGPCEYTTEPFKARILLIEKDSIREDSTFRVNNIVHIQQIEGIIPENTLNEFYDSEFDDAFIRRNKLKEGKVLTGKVKRITKGTCKPYYIWFDQAFSR